MQYGYGRVSREKQDTALQRDAFKRAGVGKIVTEKWSSVGERPRLMLLLDALAPGDDLVVWKVDRMGRDLYDLLWLLRRIHSAGANFRSLTEPIDTRTPLGKLVFSMAGAVAEYERNLIRERTRAGVHAARARGARLGRPPLLEPHDEREMVALLESGLVTYSECAEIYGVPMYAVNNAVYRKRRRAGEPQRRPWGHGWARDS